MILNELDTVAAVERAAESHEFRDASDALQDFVNAERVVQSIPDEHTSRLDDAMFRRDLAAEEFRRTLAAAVVRAVQEMSR